MLISYSLYCTFLILITILVIVTLFYITHKLWPYPEDNTAKFLAFLMLIVPMVGAHIFNSSCTYNVYIIEDEGSVLSYNQEVLIGTATYDDGKKTTVLNGVAGQSHIINKTEQEFSVERIVYGKTGQSKDDDLVILSYNVQQIDVPKLHYFPYDTPPMSVSSKGDVEIHYYLKQDYVPNAASDTLSKEDLYLYEEK